MFSHISWNEYLTGLALFTGGYYILVLLVFYRQEVLACLTGNRKIPLPASNSEDGDPSFEGLEEIVTDVRGILKKAGRKADKSVLSEHLKLRLANFAGLRQPAFRTALQNYIATQADHFCSVTFTVEELEDMLEKISP